MGLETATFLNGLTPSWPLSGDTKSQGDDHLRLIKATLQMTFPTASKAFYFPTSGVSTTPVTVLSSEQNKLWRIDPSAGDVAVTLPTLAAGDAGWSCKIVRSGSFNTNGIVVSPPTGTILCRYGAVATIRIEAMYEVTEFIWDGSVWISVKPGPLVGSSMNWDGATVPPGYRLADGTAYSTTTFAELNAALGTATLKDKRGRSEIGVDTGNVNMSSGSWGASATLGSVKSGGTATLITANLPTYTPGGSIANGAISISQNAVSGSTTTGGGGFPCGANTGASISASQGTSIFTGTAQGGTSQAFSIVGPSIVTNKLVRVA